MADQITDRLRARFSAHLLPILAEWETTAWVNPSYEGVQVEPSPAGGVDIVATDGCALLWIHEPAETSRASRPFILDTWHPGLLKACREPRRPRLIDVNQDEPAYEMPAWLRPGSLIVEQLGDGDSAEHLILVQTLAQPPDEVRRRFVDGTGLWSKSVKPAFRHPMGNWRRAFEEHVPTPTTAAYLQLRYLSKLRRLKRAFGAPWSCRVTMGGERGAVLFTIESPIAPEASLSARALLMPLEPPT